MDSGWERARQQVYGFFAVLLLRQPTPESLAGLLCEQGLAGLQALFPGEPAVQRLGLLAKERSRGLWPHAEFLSDFESLLRVPGENYLHPYEAAYATAPEGGGQARLCTARTQEVARAYAAQSLGPGEGSPELPDHLGVELEFMAYLCGHAASRLEEDDREDAGRYTMLQETFFQEHLEQWAFDCLSRMEARAQTPFYRCLASLLGRFLREEQQRLSASARAQEGPCSAVS